MPANAAGSSTLLGDSAMIAPAPAPAVRRKRPVDVEEDQPRVAAGSPLLQPPSGYQPVPERPRRGCRAARAPQDAAAGDGGMDEGVALRRERDVREPIAGLAAEEQEVARPGASSEPTAPHPTWSAASRGSDQCRGRRRSVCTRPGAVDAPGRHAAPLVRRDPEMLRAHRSGAWARAPRRDSPAAGVTSPSRCVPRGAVGQSHPASLPSDTRPGAAAADRGRPMLTAWRPGSSAAPQRAILGQLHPRPRRR